MPERVVRVGGCFRDKPQDNHAVASITASIGPAAATAEIVRSGTTRAGNLSGTSGRSKVTVQGDLLAGTTSGIQ